MPLRPPPGRSGRIWLTHRLAVASRGAELLDLKRRALLTEKARLREAVERTTRRFGDAWREARQWTARAVIMAGTRPFVLARSHASPPARAAVRWRSYMGVSYPDSVELVAARLPPASALGVSPSLEPAMAANARALAAALEQAAAVKSLELVNEELDMTTRRQRVIERRWVPLLRRTLHDLEMRLGEMELEDGVRTRWLAKRRS